MEETKENKGIMKLEVGKWHALENRSLAQLDRPRQKFGEFALSRLIEVVAEDIKQTEGLSSSEKEALLVEYFFLLLRCKAPFNEEFSGLKLL